MAVRFAFVDDPARLAEVPDGFEVVALDPFVLYAATRAGADARPLDARVDDLELERLGEETFGRAGAIADALDAVLGLSETTARWRFQQLKTIYDGLLARTLGAQRLARETGAGEALLLVRAESLAAAALPPALAAEGFSVSTAATPAPTVALPTAPLQARLAALRTGVRRTLRRQRPRILCLDEAYSLPAIAAALRDRGADPLLWLPPPRAARPATAPALSELAPLFRIEDVDLWPAAEGRLRRLAECELPVDAAAFRAAQAVIRRDRPDVLLGSAFAAPAAKAAAHAARAAGVPTIAARHGELGTQSLPVMAFNDLDVVDRVLCWGAWEARYVAAHSVGRAEAVVVGAPMIEQVIAERISRVEARRRLGLGDDLPVILFAPNALNGDHWFAGRCGPPDLSTMRHQVAVIEQLLALEGVRVVVKEHPQWGGSGPLAAWAAATGARVTFVREPRFADVVDLGDATVLDFASTTLVQALHGSARIYVVHHPTTVWEPGVVDHLERHAVRVVPPARIGETLASDLEAGLLGVPAIYDRDAREPLLASGPGTAADRSADVVLGVVRGDAPD